MCYRFKMQRKKPAENIDAEWGVDLFDAIYKNSKCFAASEIFFASQFALKQQSNNDQIAFHCKYCLRGRLEKDIGDNFYADFQECSGSLTHVCLHNWVSLFQKAAPPNLQPHLSTEGSEWILCLSPWSFLTRGYCAPNFTTADNVNHKSLVNLNYILYLHFTNWRIKCV